MGPRDGPSRNIDAERTVALQLPYLIVSCFLLTVLVKYFVQILPSFHYKHANG